MVAEEAFVERPLVRVGSDIDVDHGGGEESSTWLLEGIE
jgi:hypothetical protein